MATYHLCDTHGFISYTDKWFVFIGFCKHFFCFLCAKGRIERGKHTYEHSARERCEMRDKDDVKVSLDYITAFLGNFDLVAVCKRRVAEEILINM